MSDEIYINTGTSFQQQYTARQPAIGTAPTIANKDAQGNANVQTPFTYQGRTPVIYQSTVNVQTPYQANTNTPYAYQANAQSQLSANKQTPYPYIANKQTTYQHQANIQTTYQYQASEQTPSIGQDRQPFTYPIASNQGQQPYIANKQNPYPYIANANVQTPYPANKQNPYPYIANAQQSYPYIASKQNPYPASAQQPYPYIADARQPSTYQNQNQISVQSPAQGRTPAIGNRGINISDVVQTYYSVYSKQEEEGGSSLSNTIRIAAKYVGNDIHIVYKGFADGNNDSPNSASTGTYGTGSDTADDFADSFVQIARIRDADSGYTVKCTQSFWSGLSGFNIGDGNSVVNNGPLSSSATSIPTDDSKYRQVTKTLIGSFGDGLEGETKVRLTLTFEHSSATMATHVITVDVNVEAQIIETDCPECCVHESMLIATGEDMKSIHDIKIGDSVVSYNFETGENELVEVEDLITIERDVDYKVNNLILTEDHPVYLETGKKASVSPSATLTNYKQEVDQIKVGDVMVKLDGTTEEITSIERYEGTHLNYAIQTKHNNFYADGILVDSVIQRKG